LDETTIIEPYTEREKIMEVAGAAYFNVTSLGGLRKTMENGSQNNKCPSRHSNRVRPEYKPVILMAS